MTHELSILLVDDEEIVHTTVGDFLSDSGHQVDSAYDGEEALTKIEAEDYDLALVDIRMPNIDGISLLEKVEKTHPELSVVIVTGQGTMDLAIQALRLGATDFLTKPVKFLELEAVIEKSVRIRQLRQTGRRLQDNIRGLQASEALREGNRRFVGESPATQEVRQLIAQAVEANVDTILITGETGTGKEIVAREIHFFAASEDSPFIAVNCPAIPESLVESELFGHVKGSFTDAKADKAGYFELADGGTLFLDEIADLSPSAQAALLRVLETRKLRRVGGGKESAVSMRVIAATNAELHERVEAGKFRDDLLYRLNLFPIHLVPLRERREDILPLAAHFLQTYAARSGKAFDGFSKGVRELLLGYDWPGNARELKNVVERAAILCRSEQIDTEHLQIQSSASPKASQSPVKSEEDIEREAIRKALEEVRWNRRKAAEILDMPYSTLRFKMDKLGIS